MNVFKFIYNLAGHPLFGWGALLLLGILEIQLQNLYYEGCEYMASLNDITTQEQRLILGMTLDRTTSQANQKLSKPLNEHAIRHLRCLWILSILGCVFIFLSIVLYSIKCCIKRCKTTLNPVKNCQKKEPWDATLLDNALHQVIQAPPAMVRSAVTTPEEPQCIVCDVSTVENVIAGPTGKRRPLLIPKSFSKRRSALQNNGALRCGPKAMRPAWDSSINVTSADSGYLSYLDKKTGFPRIVANAKVQEFHLDDSNHDAVSLPITTQDTQITSSIAEHTVQH